MRRRIIAMVLLFIGQSTYFTHPASAQSPAPQQQGAAARRLNTASMSRFELQRTLTDLDERRRRSRAAVEPADSVLRLFIVDTLRLSAATRPSAIVRDSARVRQLFLQLRQDPASRDLRTQLADAIEITANDFASIEQTLNSRIATADVARDYLERSPYSAVVVGWQPKPSENTRLWAVLAQPDDPRVPPTPLSRSLLSEFDAAIADSTFQAYRASLLSAYAARIGDVRMLSKPDHEEIVRIQEEAALVSRDLGQREDDQSKLDSRLITFGLPVVGAVLVGLLFAPLVYKNIELRRSLITSGLLLEMITVFLLVAAVIILGIGGRIQAEVIGTLLGGVSGYLLGRAVNPPLRH